MHGLEAELWKEAVASNELGEEPVACVEGEVESKEHSALGEMVSHAPEDREEEQIEADIAARKLWANPEWFDVDQLRVFFTELHQRAFVPGGGMRQLEAALRSPDRIDGLRALDIPALVVHGENDTLLLIEHGRRTAELIPGAEFLEIEGMSHDFVYQVWPPLVEAMTVLTARTFDG